MLSRTKAKKLVKRNPLLLVALLAIVTLTISQLITVYHFNNIIYVKSLPMAEDPLEAWSEASYVVWEYNSTHYCSRNMSTRAVTGSTGEYLGTSDDNAIQFAINNCTAVGGTVYVKAPHTLGTYNAAVTLKDKVRLVLENGAAGITVTIDSGATASLEDYHNFVFKRWDAGVLVGFVEDRSEVGTASYVVFKEGSYYFARNESTGSIDYSGTDARVLIQSALDHLTNGGLVFIRNTDDGEYPIPLTTVGANTYGLVMNHSELSLVCEEGAWLKVPDNSDATGATSNFGVLMLSWGYLYRENLYVKVNIDGNNASQTNDQNLIVVSRTHERAVIEDCNIQNASGYGVWGMTSDEIIVRNNQINNCDKSGVHVENTVTVIYEGNKINNTATAFFVTGGASNPCTFKCKYNEGTYSFEEHGIYVSDYISEARIIGNLFANNNRTGIRAGNKGLQNAVISSNVCVNNTVGGIWIECGSGAVFGDRVEVSNNVATGNGYGIQAHKVFNLLIVGNVCNNNTNRGINFSSAGNQTVTSNIANFNVIGINAEGQGMTANATITNNHCVGNTDYDINIDYGFDYGFIAINYVDSMYIDHTTETCDYNRFFGNYINTLTQSAGACAGNTYVDNYPDNTP